jgi:hypothetical protein
MTPSSFCDSSVFNCGIIFCIPDHMSRTMICFPNSAGDIV